MASNGEWNFILAVLFFYGFLYSMYFISEGSIAGIGDNAGMAFPTPQEPTDNVLLNLINSGTYAMETLWSFFGALFLNPFAGMWWLTAVNWAFLGTTVYIFIRTLRGGG